MQPWKFLRREPLVHFIGLTLLLFAAHGLFGTRNAEVLRVDRATQAYLIKNREELLLRPLTDEEKRATVNNYIENEILVREGRKQGFGNSSKIRRLLVQNMRFFIAGDLARPGEEELRAYFDQNIERFTSPASLDLEHVYFRGQPPAGTLDKLKAGADYTTLGDLPDNRSRFLRAVNQGQLAGYFGAESAKMMLSITDAQWHGPFKSATGNHFIRISGRNEPTPARYEPGSSWLAGEWMNDKSRELIAKELRKYRENYRIVIESNTDTGAN